MPLTVLQVKNLKPENKPYKRSDGQGLNIHVDGNSKYWRLSYRFANKQKTLALGVWPEVSLQEARERKEAARRHLANGIDPSEFRKASKNLMHTLYENTFESVTVEWLTGRNHTISENHSATVLRRLQQDIFPYLGNQPIANIKSPQLLWCLRKVEARGALETAHRILQTCGMIFRYSIATGRAERDIAADLKGALPPVKEKHHSSITNPIAIGQLLRAIDGYERSSAVVKYALQLAPLVFVRPGELRHGEWSELSLTNAEWRIPGEKMKLGSVHIIPLSKQAVNIFENLQLITGKDKYFFPSNRSRSRPMSENTVNAALRTLGYDKSEMTGHGFRSMASTLLHEQGWPPQAIERQLAHAERNSVAGAYNYSEHLPKRKEMMQHWSDYLDTLKGK